MTVRTTFFRPSWRDPNYPIVFNRLVIPSYQCVCKKQEFQKRLKMIESIEGTPGLAENHELDQLMKLINQKHQTPSDEQ